MGQYSEPMTLQMDGEWMGADMEVGRPGGRPGVGSHRPEVWAEVGGGRHVKCSCWLD